ncbi:MAG: ribosome biogenesis GTP-binding protein YihA/YsxC [Myxococcota bacterium]
MSAASSPKPWEIVEACFEAGAAAPDSLPASVGVEVAFAGRSNVGKSSLLNALVRRRNLVRTSATPGCTRQINFFRAVARDEAVFRLVDLPGYGYAKRSKAERAAWGRLIEHFILERTWLRAVVVLVDVRRGVEEEEEQLIEFVGRRGAGQADPCRVIVVATKVDRVPKSKRLATLKRFALPKGARRLGVSAVTGDGLEALWREIRRATFVGAEPSSPSPRAAPGDAMH